MSSDNSKVAVGQFGGKVDKAALLHSLADNPELEGVVVVCKWKEKGMTTGWSSMSTGDLALAVLALHDDVLHESRGVAPED